MPDAVEVQIDGLPGETVSWSVIARDIVRLCRPGHWLKNVFVAAPLLFSETFTSVPNILATSIAVGCFCCWSSAIYIINDVFDANADRQHATKRRRPIAAGRVKPAQGIAFSIALMAIASLAAHLWLPVPFLIFGGVYVANTMLYCTILKHRVIADVMSIAVGFVIRLLAGSAAIGVEPTPWLIVCGFSLALVLGFGKRRAEVATLGDGTSYRPVLISYDAMKLNMLLGVATSMCLLSYTLYTVAPDTIARHHTSALVYTVPMVAYGLLRYAFKAIEGRGDGPVEILTGDRVFALTGVIWGATVLAILLMHK